MPVRDDQLSSEPVSVFLCHANEDKDEIRQLRDRLEKNGIRVWFDESSLEGGQNWEQTIRDNMSKSDYVIVCLSNHVVNKKGFVQTEIEIALNLANEKTERFLIPAPIESVNIPDSLRKRHAVFLFEPYGYERLLHSLKKPAAHRLFILQRLAVAGVSLAGVAGYVFYLVYRTPTIVVPPDTSVFGLVFTLSMFCTVFHGLLWMLVDNVLCGWNYSAKGVPTGKSAAALALSLIGPLAFVPALYQAVAKISIISASHWLAMVFVIPLAVAGHLIMYGTRHNGIRQHYAETGVYRSWKDGLKLEAIYATVYFSFIVLSYRLILFPGALVDGIERTFFSGAAFFAGMLFFIALEFPGSLHDEFLIQTRGMVSGFLLIFCFCGGMYC